ARRVHEERGRRVALPAAGEEVLMASLVAADAPAEATTEVETPADTGIQSFLVTFIIRRFDPEVDEEPRWVDYDVELYSTDRVLAPRTARAPRPPAAARRAPLGARSRGGRAPAARPPGGAPAPAQPPPPPQSAPPGAPTAPPTTPLASPSARS